MFKTSLPGKSSFFRLPFRKTLFVNPFFPKRQAIFLPTKTTLPTKQRQNQVVGAAAATSCGATATDGGKKRKKGDGWGPYKVGPKNPVMRRFVAPLIPPVTHLFVPFIWVKNSIY